MPPPRAGKPYPEVQVPLHDLKCEAGHVHRDEYVKRVPADDDFGPCSTPDCIAPMHQYWGETHNSRKADGFEPKSIDGQKFATRDEWNAHLRKMQLAHPTMEIVVDDASPARWRAEGEENRHEAFRRIGVGTDDQLRKYIRAVKEHQRNTRNNPPARR